MSCCWYEQDCDWCIPVLVYFDQFQSWAKRTGKKNFGDEAEKAFRKQFLPAIKLPEKDDQSIKSGLYLNLYHGSEGPFIGPLSRFKMTYLNCISLTFNDDLDALRYGLNRDLPELTTKEDCVEFNGVYYGDWSIEFYDEK